MAHDFEQTLREVFGDSLNRLSQFQSEQVRKLQNKLHEIAREAVKDDLTKIHQELTELRAKLAELEAERAHQAAEDV